MTYPPPGGYDPRQYQQQPPSQPPQPPSDPYSQGYGAPPPPPPQQGYDPGHPQQYSQQLPPTMTPPVGVQPGYPPGPPGLPPQQMPKQNNNLVVILGVIVGLVVILGVAAVLFVPRMLEDDEPTAQAIDAPTSEEEVDESPSDDEDSGGDDEGSDDGGPAEGSGSFDDWGEPVNSEDYDPNTPEGAAITWVVAADLGDIEAMESLMCSNPSSELEWELEYYTETEPGEYEFLIWGVSREVDGEIQAWANWTWDDGPPTEDDVYTAFVAVEEGGEWKLCDYFYL